MELKTKEGLQLISSEKLQKLEKIAQFIKEKNVISSLSSAWRKVEMIEKMLKEVFNGDTKEIPKR